MLSKYIAIPFGIGLVIFGTLAFLVGPQYSKGLIPCFLALAAIYSLHPQIDWWWAQTHPPVMDDKLRVWVRKVSPFYNTLNEAERTKFETRVMLYLMANEFLLKSPKEDGTMPDDLKALFAIPQVELTFFMPDGDNDNWRFKKFERLVFYPHPFPTPNFPTLHHSELETTDGVVIANLQKVISWIQDAGNQFSNLHYEYAKIFLMALPKHGLYDALPSMKDFGWEDLEKIFNMDQETIGEHVGLANIDPRAVLIQSFFTKNAQLNAVRPDLFERLYSIFGKSVNGKNDGAVDF